MGCNSVPFTFNNLSDIDTRTAWSICRKIQATITEFGLFGLERAKIICNVRVSSLAGVPVLYIPNCSKPILSQVSWKTARYFDNF